MQQITHKDLGRILFECAGEMESHSWNEEILDTEFLDLGYDSIAILETSARIQQEYGIRVRDEDIADLTTPRSFLDYLDQVSASRA